MLQMCSQFISLVVFIMGGDECQLKTQYLINRITDHKLSISITKCIRTFYICDIHVHVKLWYAHTPKWYPYEK